MPLRDVPELLGPYKLLRRVGRGGMAQVYLAVVYGASGFEKRVAIKTLLPEHRANDDLLRQLIREARLGAMLQHSNLVQVHDLGVDQGIYYVRMDFIDGADLDSLMRRQPPSAALSMLILEEVALALEYVHHFKDQDGRPLGLIHRDISPSNILISRAGEVKLADFGVAKATHLASATRGNVRKGKYAYMSPEQIGGEALTQTSDQFGVGVTLMELLVGRRPYDGETVMDTMDLIREAKPPALGDIEEHLRWTILRCLARNPQQRFPETSALRQAISHARRTLAPVGAPELGAYARALLDA